MTKGRIWAMAARNKYRELHPTAEMVGWVSFDSSDGDVCLDGDFNATELRTLADILDGKVEVDEGSVR